MNINVIMKQLNTLPMETWGFLGMNHTAIEEQVPVIAGAVTAQVPEVSRWAEGIRTDGVYTGEEIPLAVGEEAARYVAENRNAGASLTIAANFAVPEPLVYRYQLTDEGNVVVDDNWIIAEENSSCTVVMVYTAETAGGLHGGLTRIAAGKNAVVNLLQVQLLGDEAVHWQDVGVVTEEGAQVRVTQIEAGAKCAVAGCYSRLAGAKSRQDITCFYFGDGSRRLDVNHVVQHIAPRTMSRIGTGGALQDSCDKIYRGTIDFVAGARDAQGSESEDTLLFSPAARNRSAPLILCGEENVNGQHAATIGKLDAGMLFYLNTRGISEAQAKQMMTEARLRVALEGFAEWEIGQELQEAVLVYMAKRMGLA